MRKLFKDDLRYGWPSEQSFDYEIVTENDGKPHCRSLMALSPEERKADKEYVDSFLMKKKKRPTRCPYGAPLFFLKEKWTSERFCGIHSTKSNNEKK